MAIVGTEVFAFYRRSLARGQSIKYLVPDPVVDYIKHNPTLYSVSIINSALCPIWLKLYCISCV